MVFWNKDKEKKSDERYAKIFWVVAIIIVSIIVVYSL